VIVAERKPFSEIMSMLGGLSKILIVGCGTCVSVCMAGGEDEVKILATQLRMAFQKEGREVEIGETVIQRQCDREFIEPLRTQLDSYDAILSMGCGAGVQLIAEVFPCKTILPALNTKFIGASEELGVWSEMCQACGDCILAETAGICPVTRCSKHLLNGPCGGSAGGECEVSPDIPCAWQLIIDRLTERNELYRLEDIRPPKDWTIIPVQRRAVET
jgi:ferredoxin